MKRKRTQKSAWQEWEEKYAQIIHCNAVNCEWHANGYCLNKDLYIDELICISVKVPETVDS